MRLSGVVSLALLVTLALVFPSQAQMNPTPAGDGRTLDLVDDLKDVIQKAEKDQRSDPRLMRQLRDLVHRYDWPWRVSLLHDDFRDGDYTYDPSWVVSNGDFRVVWGAGLRASFDATRQGRRFVDDRRGESPAIDLLEGIFGPGKNRDARGNFQTSSPSPAEIYTRLPISNAFAMRLQLKFRNNNQDDNNRLEFGPYLSEERNLGYRLAYESGSRPSLSLLRVQRGRSSVIDTYDRGIDLEDGKPHVIEWRRGADSEMVVLLDEKEIMRGGDRAFSEPFEGFNLINKGGVYELKEISIFGTSR